MADDQFLSGLQAIVDAGKQGKQGVDLMVAASEAMFGADDPDTEFYRWLSANRTNLRQAAADLSIEVTEGDGFVRRLKTAYQERMREQQS